MNNELIHIIIGAMVTDDILLSVEAWDRAKALASSLTDADLDTCIQEACRLLGRF